MEARVIEKTTLKRLGREFIFTWSKIMGKTSTSKDIERNMVEVLLQVQNRIWGLIVEDRRGHAIDQGMCSKNRITLEADKNIIVKEKGTSGFN